MNDVLDDLHVASVVLVLVLAQLPGVLHVAVLNSQLAHDPNAGIDERIVGNELLLEQHERIATVVDAHKHVLVQDTKEQVLNAQDHAALVPALDLCEGRVRVVNSVVGGAGIGELWGVIILINKFADYYNLNQFDATMEPKDHDPDVLRKLK